MWALNIFSTVLTILGILLLAYWCSRMMGKKWGTISGPSASGHMRIVEQLPVGQDKRILLLELGEQYYLVGVSQAGIQLLSQVEGDFHVDRPENPVKTELPTSFQEIFDKYRKRRDEKGGFDR